MTRHNPTPDPALLQDSVEGLLGAPESERLRRLVESDEGWAAASRREEAFLRFLGTPLDEPLPAGLHDAILAAARRTPPRRAFLPRLSPVLEYALAFGGAAAVLALVLAGRSAVPAAVPEAFATGAVLLARGVTVLKAALFASSSAFSEAGRLFHCMEPVAPVARHAMRSAVADALPVLLTASALFVLAAVRMRRSAATIQRKGGTHAGLLV